MGSNVSFKGLIYIVNPFIAHDLDSDITPFQARILMVKTTSECGLLELERVDWWSGSEGKLTVIPKPDRWILNGTEFKIYEKDR